VLVRFAYLAVSNAFAALRLLPMSDRHKDVEILTLRHQITVWGALKILDTDPHVGL
jgi:putative transposase